MWQNCTLVSWWCIDGKMISSLSISFLRMWRRSLRTWPSLGNSHEKNGSIHRPINWICVSVENLWKCPGRWDEIWKLTGVHYRTPGPKQHIVIREINSKLPHLCIVSFAPNGSHLMTPGWSNSNGIFNFFLLNVSAGFLGEHVLGKSWTHHVTKVSGMSKYGDAAKTRSKSC